jgi:serine/threonine-protein kinase
MSLYKFGRYVIKSLIKRGGMATVFQAYDPRFRRDVALKVLPPEFTHNSDFRIRFEREAHTVASLEHPAIVPVYDFGEEGNMLYLVMRFLPGGSLTDRLKQGTLSLAEAARIISHIAPALDEVHQKGIIHRDLKPGNILFDQRDIPFITDFGIAKFTQEDVGITATGTLVGTPAYMSPEQAKGESALDARTDIYAIGAILFEMLAGRLPYQADTPMGIALKHIIEPVPNILAVKPDLPPACQAIIARAMAKKAEERYPTSMALAAALANSARLSPQATPFSIKANPTGPERQVEPLGITPSTTPPERSETIQQKVHRLVRELDDGAKYDFARITLNSLGDAAIQPLTETLLKAPEVSVRCNSATMLKQICEEREIKKFNEVRAIKALTKALSDPETPVRYCSVRALGVFKGKQAETAVEALAALLGDPDENVRAQAQKTLSAIGGKHARKALRDHKGLRSWLKG